jgi:hypothetical protein
MKSNELLPIGSVVLLKGASKRIMVSGYYSIPDSEKDKIYDYCGFLYPEGFLSSNQICVFNHEQIDKVFFLGYTDVEREKFMETLDNFINNNKNNEENEEFEEFKPEKE